MTRNFSLLYKNGLKEKARANVKSHFHESLQEDLNLAKLLDFLFQGEKCQKKAALLDILMDMSTDLSDIDYRLDISYELLEKPHLPKKILELAAQASTLKRDRKIIVSYRRTNPFKQLKSSAEHLLSYLKLFKTLADVLEDQILYKSEGLQNLAGYVIGYASSSDYLELLTLLHQLKNSRGDSFNFKLSVTRDLNYRLSQAIFMEINNDAPYLPRHKGNKSIIGNLLRPNQDKTSERLITDHDILKHGSVAEVLEKSLLHLGGVISSITSALIFFFSNLEKEMYFYMAVVEILQKLNKLSLPVCRPKFVAKESKLFEAEGIYDLSLALYLASQAEFSLDGIVRNDVSMNNKQGHIFIVTGPNQGGKTTYLRAVGIIQLLAQAGIPVPADHVVLAPVDRIFTHFSSVERADSYQGRLAEEMGRLEQIMGQISGDSLLLMNESFSSTNSREGTIIAEDILSALSMIGTRVIFVTHLYELAKQIDKINMSMTGRTKLVSMVAGIEETPNSYINHVKFIRRTYLVKPGDPLPTGFASDIAHQYEISYEDLMENGN